MADGHSKGKSKRVNDDSHDENVDDEIHDYHHRNDRTRRRDCFSQKMFDRISARDETRMHVGDHYGDVNIHQPGAGPASGSKASEPDAIKSALKSLTFDEMDSRYLTISSTLPSTCDWLFDREEYRRWQDVNMVPEHHGFFWVKGKAGAGKSTLMKHAFRKAEKEAEGNCMVVCFFFNARGAPIEKSLEGMFRSLLYQLFDKLPRLKSLLNKRRTVSTLRHGWSLNLLQDVFRDVVESLDSDRLTCYVDALDECPEEDAKKMVSFFEELGELSMINGIQFYVCLASRHYPRIGIRKSETVNLEKSPGHGDDIAKYVRRKLRIGNRKSKQEIVAEIERRASGVFLWVELVVGTLNTECDRGNAQTARDLLDKIPTKIKNVIEDIVKRGRSSRHLVPLLQWVLFSKRPLSREELYLALQCTNGALSKDAHSKSALSTKNGDRFILDSSKGLAEMTKGKNPRVQFIHELVRTHFLEDGGLVSLEPALRTDMVGKSHDQLRRCCSTYQLSDHCAEMQLPAPLPDVGSREHKELRQSTIDAYPFLRYVIESALYHANEAHVGGVDQHDFVSSFAHDAWATLHNVFATSKKHQLCNILSTAHVFASQRLPGLLEIAFRIVSVPDFAAHEWYYHLLSAALQAEDCESARMTVAQSSSDCHHDKDNGLTLWQAVSNCDLETVKAVLEAKLKPYNPRAVSRTAIALAASNPDKFGSELGRFGLLRLLIRHISDADMKNAYCRSALTMALEKVCFKGDVDTSKELLAKGANAIGTIYYSPISGACASGNQALVLLLIQKGVDLEDARGKTALWHACGEGHELIVRSLLEQGANVDKRDRWGQSPLAAAVERDHVAVARLLIESEADVNAAEFGGRTALLYSCQQGNESLVRMLIERGADINQGPSALVAALAKKHKTIAQLLVERGAFVDDHARWLGSELGIMW